MRNTALKNAELDHAFINMLEIIFQNCPDGMVFRDSAHTYITANKAFYDYFKLEYESEFIGTRTCPFLDEDNQQLIDDVDNTILKEHRAISFVISEKTDSEKILNITSIPIFFKEDFIGILSLIRDITQEENLKEKFVFKHYQLKALLENIPMNIYMLDKNFNYIAGTKSARDFVNNGYDSLSNLHINRTITGKEDRDDNNYVIKNNKILIKEKEFLDYNKSSHWYKVYKVPVNNLNGEISGIITIADNIDSEKQLQTQRETFVASIGHDLKNPTIAQIRSLELLLNGNFGKLSNKQKEIIEMVLDSCRYMNGMLASLLATYRNYGGIVNLNFENFSLSDLVNECVTEMIYVAKEKGISILTENTYQDSIVNADRVQIKRVIMNFISNGIKYAFSNSKLKLSIYSEGENACFKFENNSPYIPEYKQKAIFDQYVSYASAYNELGIGLGLYASQKIIEGHSGTIYVKSFKDDRNIFGFKIPIKQALLDKENTIIF